MTSSNIKAHSSNTTMDIAERQQPELIVVEEEVEGNGEFLIEDVVHNLCAVMSIKELRNCRLVCDLWARCATKRLQEIGTPIKIVRNRYGSKLKKFIDTISNRSSHRPLPFSKFHIDISCHISLSFYNLRTVFETISQKVSCKKLKIIYSYRPDSPKEALVAARVRSGKMSFKHINYLCFNIRFYDDFTPEFVNMKEIVENSGGIKKLNVCLQSYISKNMQRPILQNIVTTLISPTNKFANLSTLSFEYTFLNDEILQLLTDWQIPLKSLALGSFDLKPEKHVGIPSASFYKFLSSKSGLLQNLRLKFDKEYPWEDMIYERMNSKPPLLRKTYAPVFVKFPVLPHLLSLELMAASPLELGWAWKLSTNTFREQFPQLKKFGVINFEYLVGDDVDFLPSIYKPSSTVEHVRLPSPKDLFDQTIFNKMISVFPAVKSLEVKFDKSTLESVFTSCRNLEVLIIHLGDQMIQLDSIFTGAPILRGRENIYGDEAKKYNLAAVQKFPSLLNLQNLKELHITTEDYRVRFGDITAYNVFLRLEKFCLIKVDAYPWDDTTEFMLSMDCKNALREKVRIELNIYTRTRREKFSM